MKIALIIGWVLLLVFLAWEFVMANELPAKYGAASPNAFRIADVLIGILALASIWYLVKK